MPTTLPSRPPAARPASAFDPGAVAAALVICLLIAGALSPSSRIEAATDLDGTAIAAMEGGL